MTDTQKRVAERMLTLVRKKQDKFRPEQLLQIVRCNKSDTHEVYQALIREGQIRVSYHGRVIAKPVRNYHNELISYLDHCEGVEHAI